jgi:hypothetical protein
MRKSAAKTKGLRTFYLHNQNKINDINEIEKEDKNCQENLKEKENSNFKNKNLTEEEKLNLNFKFRSLKENLNFNNENLEENNQNLGKKDFLKENEEYENHDNNFYYKSRNKNLNKKDISGNDNNNENPINKIKFRNNKEKTNDRMFENNSNLNLKISKFKIKNKKQKMDDECNSIKSKKQLKNKNERSPFCLETYNLDFLKDKIQSAFTYFKKYLNFTNKRKYTKRKVNLKLFLIIFLFFIAAVVFTYFCFIKKKKKSFFEKIFSSINSFLNFKYDLKVIESISYFNLKRIANYFQFSVSLT